MHPFTISPIRPNSLRVEESDLIDLSNIATNAVVRRELSHAFIRRNLLYSFNGFSRIDLKSKHAEWLVITPYYDQFTLIKISNSTSGESFYLQTDFVPAYKAICDHKGFNLEIIDGF